MKQKKIKSRPEISFDKRNVKELIKNFKRKRNQNKKGLEYGKKSFQIYRYIKREEIYKKVLG